LSSPKIVPSPVIRRATEADVPAMVALRREAEAWLAGRGIEQWTRKWEGIGDEKLRRAARQGRAWIISVRGDAGGTVSLGGPDEDLWHVEDGPALQVYKMIVARRHAGRGLGSLILDWATDQAARHGHPWRRLDTWPANPGRMDYYRAQGFTHVRTERVPGRDTGALFERPADRTTFPGPAPG
jgi:GNAT superfamily N-acetyltransferase